MEKRITQNILSIIGPTILFVLTCLFGLWFVIIVPLGPQLAHLPGDLAESRLNNFFLEHFFRWISGLEKSFWDSQIYYPFPRTTAFSDNFLGSGIIYSIFRWTGFDRETAFQAWYICGFILNYAASAFALFRLKFKPIGIAAGAFFFTFGLPVLAQEYHVQLLYRFGVPLACLNLWLFNETPRIRHLIMLLFWTIWQLYLSIYTGVFLSLMLVSLAILMPFFKADQTIIGLFTYWPDTLRATWNRSSLRERLLSIPAVFLLLAALVTLLFPYYQVTKLYDFSLVWDDVSSMLPTWRSFFIADRAQLWKPISLLLQDVPMRSEHNLFVGISTMLVILTSFVWNRSKNNKSVVLLHVFSTILIIVFFIKIKGFSLYYLIGSLPGMTSIRATSRIILILMWPIALVISQTIDKLTNPVNKRYVLLSGVAYLLLIGLMIEPIFYEHASFNKFSAQKRVTDLRAKIPSRLPSQPVLIVANNSYEFAGYTDLDGMLLAQEIGWPVMNGYSGSNAPGYGLTYTCRSLPQRVLAYMNFAKITSDTYYTEMMNRAVPIGFNDCNPRWSLKKPSIIAGPFPKEIFEGISIEITSIKKIDEEVIAEVTISNHSPYTLPVLSSTDNPFRLSWRMVNKNTNQALSGFDERIDLDYDIYPGGQESLTIKIAPPQEAGLYQLEVAAVQELLDWFYNRGTPVASSQQGILIDDQNTLSIIDTPSP